MPLKEKLHSFFIKKMIEKILMINAPIFSVIIGEIMWDPKDVERQTHTNMMACFTDIGDDSEVLKSSHGRDRYRVVIKKQVQWSL